MLEQDGAESGLGFLRSSDAELQPRDPQPDSVSVGFSATIRSKMARPRRFSPTAPAVRRGFESVDGDCDVKDRTSAVTRAISMAA
jgi:hypothetical protein